MDLNDICATWQERLRLQDWRIEVKVVGHDDVSEHSLGCVMTVNDRKKALIKILRDEDCAECDKGHAERTLVHELIHLHFEPFWTDEKKTELELAINMLAGAFVPPTDKV